MYDLSILCDALFVLVDQSVSIHLMFLCAFCFLKQHVLLSNVSFFLLHFPFLFPHYFRLLMSHRFRAESCCFVDCLLLLRLKVKTLFFQDVVPIFLPKMNLTKSFPCYCFLRYVCYWWYYWYCSLRPLSPTK